MKTKLNKKATRLITLMALTVGAIGTTIALSSIPSTNNIGNVSNVMATRSQTVDTNQPTNPEGPKDPLIEIPAINDTNAKTLIMGTNFIRLNNKVTFDSTTNSMVPISILGIYDEHMNAVQEIQLPAGYTQLSAINSNNIQDGIVVSSYDSTQSRYYGIDLKNKCLDEESMKIVEVPLNSYSVGANFNSNIDDIVTNNKVVVSASISSAPVDETQTAPSTQTTSYLFDLTITDIKDGSTAKLSDAIDTAGISNYNFIELVDSYAIDNNLYLGINFLYNKAIVGSQLILLRDGQIVKGGPTFGMPFNINAMAYDKQHRSLYLQYYDRKQDTLRMWCYDTGRPDRFAQVGSLANGNKFDQMVIVPDVGVAALAKNKSEVRLYPFDDSFMIAPCFDTVKAVYQNSYMRANNQTVSDLVFNPNTKRFSLFYAYDAYVDGIINWTDLNANISSESYYTNIAPVHIDYQKMLTHEKADGWLNQFASVYVGKQSANLFNEFLIIPSFYEGIRTESLLNSNENFTITHSVNDSTGSFHLKVDIKDETLKKDISPVDFTVRGFEQVNANNISVNYNSYSSILTKTPTEVEALLNDPETAQVTKDRIFELFGIDKRYSALPFEIKINGYNVLGYTDLEIIFPTVFKNEPEQQDEGTLVPKSSIVTGVTNAASELAFRNNFQLTIEHWFIPVMTVVSMIVLALILVAMWYSFGKKLYRNYATWSEEKLVAEYEALNILADSDEAVQDNFGNLRNPIEVVGTTQINLDRVQNNEQKIRFREELPYIQKRERDKTHSRIIKNRLEDFHKMLTQRNIGWAPQMLLTTPIAN